jgi:hypothetical protein
MEARELKIDGRVYRANLRRATVAPPEAPRLVVVGFQPNPIASQILRLCVDSIRRFTRPPYELWVVDNASPPETHRWLLESSDLNVVLNRMQPAPPGRPIGKFLERLTGRRKDPYLASYANAIALEIAARLIDPGSHYMMSLHMDTMACRVGWLDFLLGQFTDRHRSVGVRLDVARVRALHVLGMMFDFRLFVPMRLSFMHRLPEYDVGDGISVALEKAGYEPWACRNTHSTPALAQELLAESPWGDLNVDRAFDDQGRVIFAHLGRGIGQSRNPRTDGKTTPEQWLAFGRRWLESEPGVEPHPSIEPAPSANEARS